MMKRESTELSGNVTALTRPGARPRQQHKLRRCALAIAVALSATGAMAGPTMAYAAQAQSTLYNIPAGDLAHGLNALAQQGQVQISYAPKLVVGKVTAGLHGRYAPASALTTILRGSAIRWKAAGPKLFVLEAANPPPVDPPQTVSEPQPDPPQSVAKKPQHPVTLQAIQVTGSHIPRAEMETSNPVVTVTSQEIARTGKLTIGGVIQNLPVITGGITNPQVDDQGGNGGTFVGLRGLGASRTLVLVDGQRIVNTDLNSIPAIAVERIEVLTDGASAVYGSDAIGGVINIILKQHFQGAQFSTNYGISDHNDGARRGVSFMFGHTSDKGSILAGVSYNKFDQVAATARKFSNGALSIAGSTATPPFTFIGGSSYNPHGWIALPKNLADQFGCPTVSLNTSAEATSPTSLNDYHCYSNQRDAYDFTASTLIETPQERTNAFLNGEYHLSDNIDAYLTVYHNKTTADRQEAPSLYGTSFGAVISKFSMYNPFGITFGGPGGATYRSRLVPAGNRVFRFATTTDQMMIGIKGAASVLGHHWTWNVGYDFGHESDVSTLFGLVNIDALNAGLGPSMVNPATGQPICVSTPGNPATAIEGCTPWDPFNMSAPSTEAVLGSTSPGLLNAYQLERVKHADISGGLLDLPAGTLRLAAGVSFRDEYSNTVPSSELILNPQLGFCALSSGCTSPLRGGFSVKEAYGELLVPLLKDLPLLSELTLDLGDRWSKYSTFGSTNNWKAALEYRPIEELLLRGTVSTVFRAPTIADVFGPPVVAFPSISQDPCDHLTAPNQACFGVPTDGSFVNNLDHQQIKGTASGSVYARFPIQPETGKSFDFGVVYSPKFAPGLSASVDFWRIYIKNVITSIGAQTVLNLCFNGDATFCPLITRFGPDSAEPGQIETLLEPVGNLGRLDTKGVDLSAKYRLPQFGFGRLTVGLNATYLSKFDIQTAPGIAGNQVLNGAGLMGTAGSPLASACPSPGGDICFFPRVRAQGSINWQRGPWDAQWRLRYLSRFDVGSHDISQGFSAVPGFKKDNPFVLHYGSTTYSDVMLSYLLEPLNTTLTVGVDNVFDKQPPIIFANNTVNVNTDPGDFDTIGRYYWGRITVSF